MNAKRIKDLLKLNSEMSEQELFDQGWDWEEVIKRIETPDGYKKIHPIIDREVSKAIRTFEEKTVPKRVEDQLQKVLAEKETEWKRQHKIVDDPALIEINKLRSELESERSARIKTERLSKAKGKLPVDLQDYAERFIDSDDERTDLILNGFLEKFNKSVEEAVANKISGGKREPRTGGDISPKDYSVEVLKNMSQADLLKNADAILSTYMK